MDEKTEAPMLWVVVEFEYHEFSRVAGVFDSAEKARAHEWDGENPYADGTRVCVVRLNEPGEITVN